MNKRLLIAGSWRTMSRYKLRTFFMSMGVALGVATLVVARSLGTGAEQQMLDKVNRMFGPSSIMVRAGGPAPSEGPTVTLKMEDLEAVERRLDQVLDWDPMVVFSRNVKVQGQSRQVAVYGHSERAETVWSRSVIEGRFFSAEDLSSAARVALIGTRIAEALYGDESPIGQELLIGSVPFRVQGVLEPVGIDPHGMDRDEDVHVPTTTAMRRLLNVDYLAMAKLVVREPEQVEQTSDQIAGILRERHNIAAGEPDDFAIFTPKFVQRMIQRANRVLKIFIPAAAGVVLLVAAIVIASIMLIVVRERIPEVGLRKAMGATEQHIGVQFLIEALLISVASGLVGLALGIAVLGAVSYKMRLPSMLTADSVALGLVAAIVVGVLAGFLPARRASKQDPVEALR